MISLNLIKFILSWRCSKTGQCIWINNTLVCMPLLTDYQNRTTYSAANGALTYQNDFRFLYTKCSFLIKTVPKFVGLPITTPSSSSRHSTWLLSQPRSHWQLDEIAGHMHRPDRSSTKTALGQRNMSSFSSLSFCGSDHTLITITGFEYESFQYILAIFKLLW